MFQRAFRDLILVIVTNVSISCCWKVYISNYKLPRDFDEAIYAIISLRLLLLLLRSNATNMIMRAFVDDDDKYFFWALRLAMTIFHSPTNSLLLSRASRCITIRRRKKHEKGEIFQWWLMPGWRWWGYDDRLVDFISAQPLAAYASTSWSPYAARRKMPCRRRPKPLSRKHDFSPMHHAARHVVGARFCHEITIYHAKRWWRFLCF